MWPQMVTTGLTVSPEKQNGDILPYKVTTKTLQKHLFIYKVNHSAYSTSLSIYSGNYKHYNTIRLKRINFRAREIIAHLFFLPILLPFYIFQAEGHNILQEIMYHVHNQCLKSYALQMDRLTKSYEVVWHLKARHLLFTSPTCKQKQ